MAEWRANRTREGFRRKYGRSLGSSRKPIHPYGGFPTVGRRLTGRRQGLTRVSRRMQEEWAAGVSQWVARREVERANLYFRRKMGLLKGHSTDEWNEGYGEWQDRALMSQAWKWLRRSGKGMSRSQAQRRMVASVRLSVVHSAARRGRMTPQRQAVPKTEAREAKPERQQEASADQLATEATDEDEILSTEPVAATFEGIHVFSQKPEKRHGPYTMMQLQKLVDQGYFTAHDLAFYQGLEQWVTLAQVPGLRIPVEESMEVPEEDPVGTGNEVPSHTETFVETSEKETPEKPDEEGRKRNLVGSLFSVVAMVCAFLILFLYLCDILNQHMGWNIPMGLGLVGVETVSARVNAPNPEVAEIGDPDGEKVRTSSRTKGELPLDIEPSGDEKFYELKDLITNLGGPIKGRYIDVELKLEGLAGDFEKILKLNEHLIRDKALTIIRNYTYEETQLDGFQERFRVDLKKGFSSVLRKYRDGESDLIRQIYFTQLVIQ